MTKQEIQFMDVVDRRVIGKIVLDKEVLRFNVVDIHLTKVAEESQFLVLCDLSAGLHVIVSIVELVFQSFHDVHRSRNVGQDAVCDSLVVDKIDQCQRVTDGRTVLVVCAVLVVYRICRIVLQCREDKVTFVTT